MQCIGSFVHFDVKGNVIVVPMLMEPSGICRLSCKFLKLQSGYTKEELAESIMKALEISIINEQEDKGRNYWTEATGIKGFATFSRKYKCISIHGILEKDGYKVISNKRNNDGSYGYDKEDIPLRVKEYPGKPSVKTIVDYVLEALKIE